VIEADLPIHAAAELNVSLNVDRRCPKPLDGVVVPDTGDVRDCNIVPSPCPIALPCFIKPSIENLFPRPGLTSTSPSPSGCVSSVGHCPSN